MNNVGDKCCLLVKVYVWWRNLVNIDNCWCLMDGNRCLLTVNMASGII